LGAWSSRFQQDVCPNPNTHLIPKIAYSYSSKNLDWECLEGKVEQDVVLGTIKQVNRLIEYSYARFKKKSTTMVAKWSTVLSFLAVAMMTTSFVSMQIPIYINVTFPNDYFVGGLL
jgi:hypothetical protein